MIPGRSRARVALAAPTLRTGQGVVVLGVVVGTVVDGTGVVVGGVGEPAFPFRGIGGGADCATGA